MQIFHSIHYIYPYYLTRSDWKAGATLYVCFTSQILAIYYSGAFCKGTNIFWGSNCGSVATKPSGNETYLGHDIVFTYM